MCSEDEYKKLVGQEYDWLVKRLNLEPVQLDFERNPDGYPAYGGEPRRIIIPYCERVLAHVSSCHATPDGGPTTWDPKHRSEFWALWRRELWHEVMHQVQDCNDSFTWNPHDKEEGHATDWQAAVEWAAPRLGCVNPRLLYVLVASNQTPPWSESAAASPGVDRPNRATRRGPQ